MQVLTSRCGKFLMQVSLNEPIWTLNYADTSDPKFHAPKFGTVGDTTWTRHNFVTFHISGRLVKN